MNLSEYLSRRGAGAELAKALGVTPEVVSQWKTGVRPVPLDRCTAIEVATDRAVRRQELRPDDWLQHWPELAAVPATEPQQAA